MAFETSFYLVSTLPMHCIFGGHKLFLNYLFFKIILLMVVLCFLIVRGNFVLIRMATGYITPKFSSHIDFEKRGGISSEYK